MSKVEGLYRKILNEIKILKQTSIQLRKAKVGGNKRNLKNETYLCDKIKDYHSLYFFDKLREFMYEYYRILQDSYSMILTLETKT